MIKIQKDNIIHFISAKELEILGKYFTDSLYYQLKGKKHLTHTNIDFYISKINYIAKILDVSDINELYSHLLLTIGVETAIIDLDTKDITNLLYPASLFLKSELIIHDLGKFSKNQFDFFHRLKAIINSKYTKLLEKSEIKKNVKELNNIRKSDNKLFCYTPYTQLYFSFDGQVLMCCQNKNFILGNIANESVQEIWQGKHKSILKESLKKYNFDKGCQECKEPLVKGNYKIIPASHFYDGYSPYIKSDNPSVFEFEISNTCNLSCLMCTDYYSSSIARNLKYPENHESAVYGKQFIEQIKGFLPDLKKTIFKGGEPFLIKPYFDIWHAIIEINNSIDVRIITNGTVFNDQVRNVLEKTNFSLNISIDSLKEETYERIRVGAKFINTMSNLLSFIEIKNKKTETGAPRIILNVCVMTLNWIEMPDFVRFCNENKLGLEFIIVKAPHYLSLKYQNPNLLDDIIDQLSNEYSGQSRPVILV